MPSIFFHIDSSDIRADFRLRGPCTIHGARTLPDIMLHSSERWSLKTNRPDKMYGKYISSSINIYISSLSRIFSARYVETFGHDQLCWLYKYDISLDIEILRSPLYG